MNNNKTDEAAVLAGCRGVFSKTSYITIGQKEKPEEYNKKAPPRSNFKGKQMLTAPPREGKTNDVYFLKKHLWISEGDKYVDRLLYAQQQKEKKKGFLTGDFKRRDEFSVNFRTEQWREQLKQETKFSKAALEEMAAAAGETEQPLSAGEYLEDNVDAGPFLYDLVFEKDDPHFSGASKTHRDTQNPTILSKDRQVGTLTTTSMLSHGPPDEFHKPQFARKPIVRDTFYRKTNIFFPESGCAGAGQE